MSAVKRAACDRCHGLKMRCIREENRAKCNRCLGSGTDCVFSVAKKAGRPSSAVARKNSYVQQQQHQHQQPTPVQQPSPPYTQSNQSMNVNVTLFSPSQENFSLSIADEYGPVTAFGDALSDPISDLPLFGTWIDGTVLSGRDLRESHQQWVENLLSGGILDKQGSPPVVEPTGDRCRSPPAQDRPNFGGNAMQQLSDLSGKLFAHISARVDPAANEAPTARLEELSARVIESSVDFHNILSNNAGPVSETTPNHGEVTSTATTLQILTAYIRLIQLHYALYTHIHSLLSPGSVSIYSSQPCSRSSNSSAASTFSSDRAVPIAFPSLSIGGISLASYPRFQLKMIVQICVHHLGEVESLLGLPAGFCVSDEGASGGDNREGGILHPDSGRMALLVRTIMLEAGDTVKGIRRVLAELVEELRGSIQV